eukprot:TRINITY_DN6436_c0_g1_i1.p1 TRINITY_DN6436_c0_g1~~TRINITY_DN6436_c0_g1_i1.p1  ORF type:complete len:329 (-),score=60.74 TRINITY_DN6436_c0_g1_i1:36-1022(-)
MQSYKHVAYSFDKIPEYNPEVQLNINWDTATYFEKYDGHKALLYFYSGNWIVSSRRIIDASDPVSFKTIDGDSKKKVTFKEEFWRVWNSLDYTMPVDTNMCYTFELLLPSYRKVVNVKEDIVLVAARDMELFHEVDIVELHTYNWNIATELEYENIENAITLTESFNPFQRIGFVVVDDQFNRIQYNSKSYISIENSTGFLNKISPFNLLANHFEPECLLEIVRLNRKHIFLKKFPHWENYIQQATINYENLLIFLEPYFSFGKDLQTQKLLAAAVRKIPYGFIKRIVFDISKYSVRPTPQEYIARMPKSKFKKLRESYLDVLTYNSL